MATANGRIGARANVRRAVRFDVYFVRYPVQGQARGELVGQNMTAEAVSALQLGAEGSAMRDRGYFRTEKVRVTR